MPAGMMIPSFVNGLGFKAYESGHTFLNNLLLPAGDNDRVFVIVQLQGGNDGLNMVVPLENFDRYVGARKNIYIVFIVGYSITSKQIGIDTVRSQTDGRIT